MSNFLYDNLFKHCVGVEMKRGRWVQGRTPVAYMVASPGSGSALLADHSDLFFLRTPDQVDSPLLKLLQVRLCGTTSHVELPCLTPAVSAVANSYSPHVSTIWSAFLLLESHLFLVHMLEYGFKLFSHN